MSNALKCDRAERLSTMKASPGSCKERVSSLIYSFALLRMYMDDPA
jgi:hypothetical protein